MKKIILLFAAICCFVASNAMAVPISGSISFLGYANYLGGTTPSDATGIHFLEPFSTFTGYGNTGDYAGIFSNNVQMSDFYFKPTLSPSPVTLWSFVSLSNGYTY